MAKNRYIDTKFWDDNYTSNLDPIEKLLFLYLLTNPLTNICGIYEIPLKRIAFDTGIDKEMVSKIIDRFTKENKVKYLNGWLAIKNWLKHQAEDGNVKKGIENGLKLAPIKLVEWIKSLQESSGPLNNPNPNPNPNSDLNSNLNIIETIAKAIILYLNEKTKKKFKPAKGNLKHIIARLNEGYTEEDCRKVIDIKSSKWLTDLKMNDYLRPETIFGSKFESYLNEKIEVNKNQNLDEYQKKLSEQSRLQMIADGIIDEEGNPL